MARRTTGSAATPAGTGRLDALASAGGALVVTLSLLAGSSVPPAGWGVALVIACVAAARLVQEQRQLPLSLRYGSLFLGLPLLAGYALLLEEPAWAALGSLVAVTVATVGLPLVRQLPLHVTALVLAGVSLWLGASALEIADRLLVVGALLVGAVLITGLAEPLWRRRSDELRSGESVRSRNRLLTALGRTVDLDVDAALHAAVDAAIAIGFDIASVSLIRDGVRYPVATRGYGHPIPPTPADTGIAGRMYRTGRTVVVTDYAQDPDRVSSRHGARAAASVPVRQDGRITGVVTAARRSPGPLDIEELTLLELVADHVAHALDSAHRYEEQRQVVAEMRRLDRAKRDFVSNVSHELRTPLTVVKGLALTLARGDGPLDGERAKMLLGRLNDNADRLAGMLAGLLDFSQLDAALAVHRRPVELSGLVVGVVERLEPLLAGCDVALQVENVVVSADPPMLEHVVENLVGNAAKHTARGTRIEVTVRAVSDGAEVVVHDDGQGIPADELPRITERYYRGRAATDATSGTGVGLSLAAEVLEAHASRLEVRSEPGRGTTFRFVLPAVGGAP
jgi:signal transduction histidine kinase